MNIIKGHHVKDGGILEAGRIFVDVIEGSAICAETGSLLTATNYTETWGSFTEISNGVWQFEPDSGECERVGIEVKKS